MSSSVVTMVELRDCNIKLDHSLGCPDDAPNWRLVPGFPIYGVGQPTNDGFNKVFNRRERDSSSVNPDCSNRSLRVSQKTALSGSTPARSQWSMSMASL